MFVTVMFILISFEPITLPQFVCNKSFFKYISRKHHLPQKISEGKSYEVFTSVEQTLYNLYVLQFNGNWSAIHKRPQLFYVANVLVGHRCRLFLCQFHRNMNEINENLLYSILMLISHELFNMLTLSILGFAIDR